MKLWQRFKYAVFDVDGTIVDNMPAATDAFVHILQSKTQSIPSDEARRFYLDTAGTPIGVQFEMVLKNHRIEVDSSTIADMEKEYFAYRERLSSWQNAKLFPCMKDVLMHLHNNGMRIFLTSGSRTEEIKDSIRKKDIDKYIDCVLGGDKIPKGQAHIREFAKFTGSPLTDFCKNAFYVGDGTRDMEIAKEAGLFASGITNTVTEEKLKAAGAKIVIKRSDELLNLDL